MAFDFNGEVYVSKIDEYDAEKIKSRLIDSFDELGINLSDYASKNVVIKPNLVIRKAPDVAATTHPAVLCALIELLSENGICPTIAESPGGIYSAARLGSIYKVCGVEDVAKKYGATLNFDVSSERMSFEGGHTLKNFNIITPIVKADVIFDVCKLKSHSLTTMSAASKNLFGTIPGVEKFEMHAAYPDINDFTSMLCDLDAMLCEKKTIIAITDGIVGMEGEGPTGGTPKKIGALLVSKSIFASDAVAARILGLGDDDVLLLSEAKKRGYIGEFDHIHISGDGIDGVKLTDFVLPESRIPPSLKLFSRGAIGKMFMPHPVITKKCRACGECVASCPQSTIRIVKGRAKINRKNCIKCYCCQELCPFVAIKTYRNPIIKIVNKLK